LAFGGMGPMHAIGLARSYGISRVIVPAASSAFSALGCVTAEHSATRQRTLRMASDGFDDTAFASARAALVAELKALLDGNAMTEIEETAMIRYRGQSYTVDVALVGPVAGPALGKLFADRHQALFGFISGQAWEVTGLRTRLRVPRQLPLPPANSTKALPQPFQTDLCWFDAEKPVATARYERATLAAPHIIQGPAIIEDDWSTTVVPPVWQASPPGNGHILLQEYSA
ncbi:MAG: hydantoinase/oxoprolinase family protein, partial [Alphaproteobacteria bacterium]